MCPQRLFKPLLKHNLFFLCPLVWSVRSRRSLTVNVRRHWIRQGRNGIKVSSELGLLLLSGMHLMKCWSNIQSWIISSGLKNISLILVATIVIVNLLYLATWWEWIIRIEATCGVWYRLFHKGLVLAPTRTLPPISDMKKHDSHQARTSFFLHNPMI